MMDRFFMAVLIVASFVAMTGRLSASATEPAPDGRDREIRDALRGLTKATVATVEADARKRLAAKPADTVANAILAGCLWFKARTVAPPRPDGTPWWPNFKGVVLRDAIDAAYKAREGGSSLGAVNELLLEALTSAVRKPEVLKALETWPASVWTPDLHRALVRGLLTLAPRSNGDVALEIAEAWYRRFPDDPEVRRGVFEVWCFGGELDRAAQMIEAWDKSGEWGLRAAELTILRVGPDSGRKKLDGKAGAEPLLTLIAGALGEENAKPALEALATGPVVRPGASTVAKALLATYGPDQAAAKKALLEAARQLIAERSWVECALALHARKRLGDWGQAEQLMLADQWRFMREWVREIDALRPLTADVDRDGKTVTGVTAGDFHFRLGRASYHARRWTDTDIEYQKAAQAGKEDPELWFHIAKLRKDQGRPNEATEWLKKAAEWRRPAEHADKAREALKPSPSPSPR